MDSRSGIAQRCSISAIAAESPGGIASARYQASDSSKIAPSSAASGAGDGAGLGALLAVGPQTNQGSGDRPEGHRLLLGEVAVLDRCDVAVRVLGNEQQVDEADDVRARAGVAAPR